MQNDKKKLIFFNFFYLRQKNTVKNIAIKSVKIMIFNKLRIKIVNCNFLSFYYSFFKYHFGVYFTIKTHSIVYKISGTHAAHAGEKPP